MAKLHHLPEGIEDIYPMSSIEKGMIFDSQIDADAPYYHGQSIYQVNDPGFDPGLFTQAFMLMIEKHPILRTGFNMYDFEQPIQAVFASGTPNYDIQHEDIAYLERPAQEEYIRQFLSKDRDNPFNVNSFQPLWRIHTFRLGKGDVAVIWICHHAIIDGWSTASLLTEFNNTYLKLKSQPGYTPDKLKISYKEFVIQEIVEQRKPENIEYWKNELEGYKKLEFARIKDQNRPGAPKRRMRRDLGVSLLHRLQAIAVQHNSSLKNIFFAAYLLTLSRISYDGDILAGLVSHNRPISQDGDKIIGCFLNVTPVRINLADIQDLSWKEFFTFIDKKLLEIKKYERMPLFEIINLVEEDINYGNPLFDTVFNFEDYHILEQIEEKTGGNGSNPLKVPGYKDKKNILDFNVRITGGTLNVYISYSEGEFREETIQHMLDFFQAILDKAGHFENKSLDLINLISESEQPLLLQHLETADDSSVPPARSLWHAFENQAIKTPGQTAVVFETNTITYEELLKLAKYISFQLTERGIGEGQIAALFFEPSIEMTAAILGVLAAGAAYMPIDPRYPAARIEYIIKDSLPAIVIAAPHSQNSELFQSLKLETFTLQTDTALAWDLQEDFNPPETMNAHTAACVIYTSGTTGNPKGVLVEHQGLLNYAFWRIRTYRLTEDDTALQLLSYCFDGFGSNFYSTLFSGGTLIMTSLNQALNGHNLAPLFKKWPITNTSFVPGMYEAMLDGLRSEDLTSLRFIVLAGEKASEALIQKSRSMLPHTWLINEYGPTETSVTAAANTNLGEDRSSVIGSPIDNASIQILNCSGIPMFEGAYGELYIGGAGVARGYLNHPQLTSERFQVKDTKHYSDNQNNTGYQVSDERRITQKSFAMRLYSTGDLARWLPGNKIEIAGRIDQQVKIRGLRVETGEIENRLLKLDAIKEAVVTANQGREQDVYLTAYIVVDGAITVLEIQDYLSQFLPNYMIPAYFIAMEEIPLTAHGKVDVKSLPVLDMEMDETPYAAPENSEQQQLIEIWSDILATSSDKIGIDTNFFEIGGHSLKATILAGRIYNRFHVKIPLKEIFQLRTIRELDRFIKQAVKETHRSISPVEKKQYYPLSPAQNRLFILQGVVAGNIAYNTPTSVVLKGEIDRDRIEDVFKTLIQRHESFRTSFHLLENVPVQRIADFHDINFHLEYKEAEEAEIRHMIKKFVRPFDLNCPPLLRAGLIKSGEHRCVLTADVHHIIADGDSVAILIREFSRLFAGEQLEPLTIHYKDFVEWRLRTAKINADRYKSRESYWLNRFKGDAPSLNLPLDYSRPSPRKFEGNRYSFILDNKVAAELNKMAAEENATLYMMLTALFNILLSRLSGQDDILIGTPTAGRIHADIEPVIGMFVNTLVLRNQPKSEKSFRHFLNEVRNDTLEAFENQDYPFEELVDKLAIERDAGRNPLFDVMLILQNLDFSAPSAPGLAMTSFKDESGVVVSKFDLTLRGIERNGQLALTFEYAASLFKTSTIKRFAAYYTKLTDSVIMNSSAFIGKIDIIPDSEKLLLLDEFNKTTASFPEHKTIVQLFQEQVERSPHHLALSSWENRGKTSYETHLTYGHLDELSTQAAAGLHSRGIGKGDIAAIKMERSAFMIIAIYAILKSGAAYMPIDPGYPEDRVDYIIRDSGAKILITDAASLPFMQSQKPIKAATPGEIAYIIYTSGSTGKPKGVMIQNNSLVNRLFWMQKHSHLTVDDVILQKTPVVFDVSVWELFWWSFTGASVCMLTPGGEKDPAALVHAIQFSHVTTMHFVPSMLDAFLHYVRASHQASRLNSLKRVFASGEALSVNQVELFRALLFETNNTRLINLYGPTEATVDVSYYNCFQDSSGEAIRIPIGKPIDNIRLYILGQDFSVQPISVPGELFIAGTGLGRGYLNRPELTAERFIETSLYPHLPSPLYKTGDLARWLPDGNIDFLGRLDRQVKVRGFRVELAEIEQCMLEFPGVKTVVVTAEDQNLFAYVVCESNETVPFEEKELKRFMALTLPVYMIPSAIIVLDRIPHTVSGKVDWKSLPRPQFNGSQENQDMIYPSTPLELKLARIWSQVLGLKTSNFSIDDNFFRLGGHSLKAVLSIASMHKEFNINVPLGEFFKNPTIRSLAGYLETASERIFTSIPPAELREYYPVTAAQKRLFLVQQMDESATIYNQPQVFRLSGDVHHSRLESSFKQLIVRHHSLRTAFIMKEGVLVQWLRDDLDFAVQFDMAKDEDDVELIIHEFVKPFDLKRAPLLRVALIEEPDSRFLLIVDTHHIITDGFSHSILMREFSALYDEKELTPQTLQYTDYAQWLAEYDGKIDLEEQEEFWLNQFKEPPPELNLPLDFERPAVQSFAGDRYRFIIEQDLLEKIEPYIVERNITLFMFLLAVYTILMSKLSGQEDIVIGTMTTGRHHADLENIIGMFVNTLPLRNQISGEISFDAFINRIRQRTLDAFERQDYQFDQLVEKLALKKDVSRNPIFDVVLMLQNLDIRTSGPDTLNIAPYRRPGMTISRFDMMFQVSPSTHNLAVVVEYNVKLFKSETIALFSRYFIDIMESVLDNPGQILSRIDIYSGVEQDRLDALLLDDLENE